MKVWIPEGKKRKQKKFFLLITMSFLCCNKISEARSSIKKTGFFKLTILEIQEYDAGICWALVTASCQEH